MKSSTFVLSFFGFCAFYICNADWIDDLYERFIENYLGGAYEEVAPFISSVTAGAEEFDQIIAELTKPKRKWYQNSVTLSFSLILLVLTIPLYQIIYMTKGRRLVKTCREFLCSFIETLNSNLKKGDEILNSVTAIPSSSIVQATGKMTPCTPATDDVPVKLLWKGGTLVESSMNCNLRSEPTDSKIIQMQKHLVQSKFLKKCTDMTGGRNEGTEISPTSSDESTAIRMAEIRRLLESEPEIIKAFMVENNGKTNEGNGDSIEDETTNLSERKRKMLPPCVTQLKRKSYRRTAPQRLVTENGILEEGQVDDGTKPGYPRNKMKQTSDYEGAPDAKLMNRIRLLESRLRLEELKNKNWINRMSRAEGILQQLNKQVERGIDSMSKGVNSSLLSGRANRRDATYGDPNGDPQDHQHSDQLGLVGSSEEKHSIHASQSVSAVLFRASVHALDEYSTLVDKSEEDGRIRDGMFEYRELNVPVKPVPSKIIGAHVLSEDIGSGRLWGIRKTRQCEVVVPPTPLTAFESITLVVFQIGFPVVDGVRGKPVYPIAQTPALSSMNFMSHSSILSKFLAR
ncbi:hypothetical protein RUM43_002527 [Polyplax serrata]|uniref:Uncharacterized protein n=1 Tax=Polyplax serrata TaxID=468196 RepID=A0AAN8NZB1_POLSC